jgi:hypothetical protein
MISEAPTHTHTHTQTQTHTHTHTHKPAERTCSLFLDPGTHTFAVKHMLPAVFTCVYSMSVVAEDLSEPTYVTYIGSFHWQKPASPLSIFDTTAKNFILGFY